MRYLSLGMQVQASRHRTQAARATATDLWEDGRSHWASYGDVVYERVRDSYDRVASGTRDEIGGELAGKPLDRALLRCLIELVADGRGELRLRHGRRPRLWSGSRRRLSRRPGRPNDRHRHLPDDGRGWPAPLSRTSRFRVGSLLALPATDGELAGAVAFYSIIHLLPEDRPAAYQEMARVIRAGGWLLLAFHTSLAGHPAGEIMHADEWWGEQVDLDFHYLDPAERRRRASPRPGSP